MTVKEQLEKQAKLVADARSLLEKVESEERDMTSEEEARYDEMLDAAEEAKQQADKLRSAEERKGRLEDLEDRLENERRSRRRTEDDSLDDDHETGANGKDDEVWRRGWDIAIRYPSDSRTPEQRQLVSEARALQADLDVSGGYLAAPPQFQRELIEAVRDDVVIGDLARTFNIPGTDVIQWPTLDTRPADPDVRGEVEAATADTATAFGFREFSPVRVAKVVLMSEKLLRVAALPIEEIMTDLYRYEFASTFESWFMTGTGASQPLGLFTAATNGISTGRDVSTGNSDTAFTTDGLIEAFYSLKAQYQRNARFLFHRDGVKMLAKLKDGEGQYLWQPSVQAGRPSTFMGVPVLMSEFAPNTFTTGLYVGIVGDFSKYYVFRFLGGAIEFKRFDEYLTADLGATAQVGIRAQQYIDAGPILEEAFARVTLT